jgi:hypothetical protein
MNLCKNHSFIETETRYEPKTGRMYQLLTCEVCGFHSVGFTNEGTNIAEREDE